MTTRRETDLSIRTRWLTEEPIPDEVVELCREDAEVQVMCQGRHAPGFGTIEYQGWQYRWERAE